MIRKGVAYRRGQRPAWLDEPAAEAQVEAFVEAGAADMTDAVVEEARSAATAKGTRSRIQVRVVEAYVEGERRSETTRARTKPEIQTADLEVPEAAVEVDDEAEAENRRRRARLRSQAEVEVEVPAADIADLEQIVEQQEDQEAEEEEEEETEDEEDESDHDDVYGRVLMKPVFVSKAQRNTVADRVNVVETVDRTDEASAAQRKKDIEASVIAAIQRDEAERELAAKAAQLEIPDDTDLPDDPVEYEKWRLREMVRILRDREARRLADEERAETERRRLLPDEVIQREHEEAQAAAPPKPKIKFLQRYHHKGVFYTDAVDQDLLQRDHLVATGIDAELDRSLLPKVLQVKNFGLASRTKYTHLTDQDTSRDNPWAEAESFAKPTGFSSRPQADRDPKRQRT